MSKPLSSLSAKPRKLVQYIRKLKPFTLYAFQVEAVVLKNQGAKSDLVFIQTKENGKILTSLHIFIILSSRQVHVMGIERDQNSTICS